MGLKDFFDTASAVEFGMTRAMDNARRYSAENETIQETRALLKDSERMLAELKAERTALADKLVAAGIARQGETVNECRDRLAEELSMLFFQMDALLRNDRSDATAWANDAAALFSEMSTVRTRVHTFNSVVPSYDAVII